MYKVALVGTHGVNKTTIAYELAGIIKRKGGTVELLTEIARECPLPLNEQATRDAYQWIIARQIQLEIEKSPRAHVLICDRSVLEVKWVTCSELATLPMPPANAEIIARICPPRSS